jgi:hypothetical protein
VPLPFHIRISSSSKCCRHIRSVSADSNEHLAARKLLVQILRTCPQKKRVGLWSGDVVLGTLRFKCDGGCRRTFHMVPSEIKQPELHKQFKFVGDVAFRASHRKYNQAVRHSSARKEHDVPIKEHMLMSNLTTPRLPSLSMSRGSLKPEILGVGRAARAKAPCAYRRC